MMEDPRSNGIHYSGPAGVGALFDASMDPATVLRMRLNGWVFFDYVDNGTLLACGIRKGPEIHITVAPGRRGTAINRRTLRGFLGPLLEEHGYLTTRVARTRPEQRDFVVRLGFQKTWEDPMFHYYLLGRVPMQRTSP
jgi:hypothetical protein